MGIQAAGAPQLAQADMMYRGPGAAYSPYVYDSYQSGPLGPHYGGGPYVASSSYDFMPYGPMAVHAVSPARNLMYPATEYYPPPMGPAPTPPAQVASEQSMVNMRGSPGVASSPNTENEANMMLNILSNFHQSGDV